MKENKDNCFFSDFNSFMAFCCVIDEYVHKRVIDS